MQLILIYQKSGEAEAECKADDGWVQFEDDAGQRRRNATWRMMNLSCSSSSSSSSTTNIINSSSSLPSSTLAATTTAAMQFKPQDFLNTFFQPYNNNTIPSPNPHHSSAAAAHDAATAEAEAQTLELFPLRSARRDEECSDNEEDEGDESGVGMSSNGSDVAPCQFFEFLPLKN